MPLVSAHQTLGRKPRPGGGPCQGREPPEAVAKPAVTGPTPPGPHPAAGSIKNANQTAGKNSWERHKKALAKTWGVHVVYTLPSQLRDIAYQNKRVIYDLLMKAAADTTLEIAADPKRLGAKIGITAVLHTWGSALTHHPHVHMIVPGGGLSDDGSRWISSRSNFLVHVKVLARLFRGKFLAMLVDAHAAGRLQFFNTHAGLADMRTFKKFLAPLRCTKWVVYCKEPFAGPKQVLRYLSRYTHRVAISNRRLVAADDGGVSFRCKDYRIEGPARWKTMTLTSHEFIRRFLIHVLPKGFHRIRHYGLFANTNRAADIARARELLDAAPSPKETAEPKALEPGEPRVLPCPCPRCGGRMILIEVFARGCEPRYRTQISTGPRTATHQNRHIMSLARFLSRDTAHPTCWSSPGSDPARSEPIDRHPLAPDAMPTNSSTHSPSPLDATPLLATMNTWLSAVHTIQPGVPLKSP